MVDEETRRKLREMGMGEMVGALDLQDAGGTAAAMPFGERVRMMVGYACEAKRAPSVKRLVQRAIRAAARPAHGARRARGHGALEREDPEEVRPLRDPRIGRVAHGGRRRPRHQLPVRAGGTTLRHQIDGAMHAVHARRVAWPPRGRRAGGRDGRPPGARRDPHRPRGRQRQETARGEEVAIRNARNARYANGVSTATRTAKRAVLTPRNNQAQHAVTVGLSRAFLGGIPLSLENSN